ncbi:MAG: DsrE family protein [Rhizobiaceae bacterium]
MSFRKTALSALLAAGFIVAPFTAQAAENKEMGLYVNLATKDTVKAGHAFAHALKLNERGHPIAFFLNGDAILIAVKNVPQTSFQDKSLQVWVKNVIAKGGKVIICSTCMALHNVMPGDLIEGVVPGSPEVVSEYLFDPNYQVISW